MGGEFRKSGAATDARATLSLARHFCTPVVNVIKGIKAVRYSRKVCYITYIKAVRYSRKVCYITYSWPYITQAEPASSVSMSVDLYCCKQCRVYSVALWP